MPDNDDGEDRQGFSIQAWGSGDPEEDRGIGIGYTMKFGKAGKSNKTRYDVGASSAPAISTHDHSILKGSGHGSGPFSREDLKRGYRLSPY